MKKMLKSAMVVLGMLIGSGVAWAAEFEFLLQGSDGIDENNYKIQREWLDKVEKDSNGRLRFELVPKQGIVSYNETLDAIRMGLIDGHLTATEYFSNKDPGISLMGNTVGAWSDTSQLLDFMNEGGGNEIMRKIYQPYGVFFVGGYTSGVESLVAKVPLDSVADLKGVRVRSPGGLISRVFAAAGAIPVELPGSQVADGLKNGFIDAADYTVFSTNQAQGLNDIAPNPVQPGFHSLPLLEFSVSQKKWDSLPNDLKALLEKEVRELGKLNTRIFREADEKAVAKARQNPNIKIHDWSAEERKKFRAIAQQQWAEIAKESENAQYAYNQLVQYFKKNNLL